MPTSSSTSSSDAVTEVLGYIIIFGIISTILVLSMVAFADLASNTRDATAEQRADSVVQRVAGVIVEASLVAENQGSDASFERTLELPDDLEGKSYLVQVLPADVDGPDRVEVTVGIYTATATVFSAGAPSGFSICDSSAGGGDIVVRFDDNYSGMPGTPCVYLESP